MPHSVKCSFDINENMLQFSYAGGTFSYRILRLESCSVVLLPGLNPACSSAVISAAKYLSLFKMTLSMTLLE